MKLFSSTYSFIGIVILAFFSLITSSLSTFAQNDEAIPYRHHIELNIGEPLSSAWGLNLMFVDHSPEAEMRFHSWAGTYRPYLGGPYSGYEDEWLSLPVTVAYYNQVLRWLQVGAEISTMSMCTTENTWEGKTYIRVFSDNKPVCVRSGPFQLFPQRNHGSVFRHLFRHQAAYGDHQTRWHHCADGGACVPAHRLGRALRQAGIRHGGVRLRLQRTAHCGPGDTVLKGMP